ncbi:MAG: hypothetical protein IPP58_15325 [Holophagaceae bacterium]|uniref:histidine kinase n=1 Tax=Candidatus Geothrix skivensis TaxID=2954439 RepID=A0A9D7SK93_9BACT|nr:hypothetical protein [Candidatus Geothrix skivensis]
MEAAFQEDLRPRLAAQLRFLAFLPGLYVAATAFDYQTFGNSGPYWFLTALRLGVWGLVGIAGALARPSRSLGTAQLLLFSGVSLVMVTEVVEHHLLVLAQGPSHPQEIPFIALFVLGIYMMLPLALHLSLISALMGTTLFLSYLVATEGLGAAVGLKALYLLFANGVGVAFRVTWNRIQRRDFALRDRLEHEVAERKAAEEEARRANEAKSRFLAVMSHEIRTPLNGVMGGIQLLQSPVLSPEQRQALEIIARNGDLLARLLDDLLDLARIEAGRLSLTLEPFGPAELLAMVHATLQPLALAKGLCFRVESSGPLPSLLVGDGLRLRQVLLNLVGNALKFTDRGEVVLSLEGREVTDPPKHFHCTFRVRDTGPGLDAEAQRRVFAPFEQGDMSIQRRHGGAGLGLAISRELLVAMGAELTLESGPGRGCLFAFSLVLPLGEAPAEAAGASPGALPLTILVVDDVEANRIVAAGLLKAWATGLCAWPAAARLWRSWAAGPSMPSCWTSTCMTWMAWRSWNASGTSPTPGWRTCPSSFPRQTRRAPASGPALRRGCRVCFPNPSGRSGSGPCWRIFPSEAWMMLHPAPGGWTRRTWRGSVVTWGRRPGPRACGPAGIRRRSAWRNWRSMHACPRPSIAWRGSRRATAWWDCTASCARPRPSWLPGGTGMWRTCRTAAGPPFGGWRKSRNLLNHRYPWRGSLPGGGRVGPLSIPIREKPMGTIRVAVSLLAAFSASTAWAQLLKVDQLKPLLATKVAPSATAKKLQFKTMMPTTARGPQRLTVADYQAMLPHLATLTNLPPDLAGRATLRGHQSRHTWGCPQRWHIGGPCRRGLPGYRRRLGHVFFGLVLGAPIPACMVFQVPPGAALNSGVAGFTAPIQGPGTYMITVYVETPLSQVSVSTLSGGAGTAGESTGPNTIAIQNGKVIVVHEVTAPRPKELQIWISPIAGTSYANFLVYSCDFMRIR